MTLRFETCTGPAIAPLIGDLARLRITVFRDYPYLYDGDAAYEASYLARYAETPSAVVVIARDGDTVVGAATGMASEDSADDFAFPLSSAGLDPSDVFYCAESVLLAAYRGQGAGQVFFEAREAHARALGRRYSVFAAVVRPEDHPSRPVEYRPLDGFWRKRGYSPLHGAKAAFDWTDLGDREPSTKSLQFWMKDLHP